VTAYRAVEGPAAEPRRQPWQCPGAAEPSDARHGRQNHHIGSFGTSLQRRRQRHLSRYRRIAASWRYTDGQRGRPGLSRRHRRITNRCQQRRFDNLADNVHLFVTGSMSFGYGASSVPNESDRGKSAGRSAMVLGESAAAPVSSPNSTLIPGPDRRVAVTSFSQEGMGASGVPSDSRQCGFAGGTIEEQRVLL
jgi:hypothetical protein